MKKVLIFCSAPSGDEAILASQELNTRRALDRHGVNHDAALVVRCLRASSDAGKQVLSQLFAIAEAGDLSVLGIEDIWRLVGSMRVADRLYAVLKSGVRVISANEGEITEDVCRLRALLFWFDHSTKFRRPSARLPRPFGFRFVTRIEPHEAPVVKRIFEAFARSKTTAAAIAAQLNADAVAAPARTPRNWDESFVRRILADERYTKIAVEDQSDSSRCIIDLSTWRAAQERLNQDRQVGGGHSEKTGD